MRDKIKSLPGEKWKIIESLAKFNKIKQYAVSSLGRIMSFEQDIQYGRILKQIEDNGYYASRISKKKSKKATVKLIYCHYALAECFLPPPLPNQTVVAHRDGNKKNNRFANIIWISSKEWYTGYVNHDFKRKPPNFRIFVNEEFRKIKSLESYGFTLHYAVSNFGRVVSYLKGMEKDGRLLTGSRQIGHGVSLKLFTINPSGKKKHYTFYRHFLVAECFLPFPLSEQTYLIHKDYDNFRNVPSNLCWVSKKEYFLHKKNSPARIAYRNRVPEKKHEGVKLTSTRVMMIKRLLKKADNVQAYRRIAQKFHISESFLYKIRRGSSWAHVN